jgi:hypothetical protein
MLTARIKTEHLRPFGRLKSSVRAGPMPRARGFLTIRRNRPISLFPAFLLPSALLHSVDPFLCRMKRIFCLSRNPQNRSNAFMV